MKKSFVLILIMAFMAVILVGCNEPIEPLINVQESSSSLTDKKASSSPISSSSLSSSSSTLVASSSSEPTASSSNVSSSKSRISSSKPQTPSSKPAVSSSTVSSKSLEQPLIFDDPIAEILIRNMANKKNGNVYPSDLHYLSSERSIGFGCNYAMNCSNWYDSRCEGGLQVDGIFKSLKAIENIPFRGIRFCYTQRDGVQQTYNMDMEWFTKTGAAVDFYIQGDYNTDNNIISKVNIKNFSSISKCKNLDSLCLRFCSGVDLSAISKQNKLETLVLEHCNISSFAGLKNLEKLSFLRVGNNAPNDLASVVLTLPNLKTLELSKCKIDTDTYNKLTQKGVDVYITGEPTYN